MPYASVDALKQSPLYARTKKLQELAPVQLDKFVAIFEEVHSRVKRNGGSEDQAESTAVAIALSAALNYKAPTTARVLEASLHYFAPNMENQIVNAENPQGAELSFNFVRQNPDVASKIVEGFQFNWDHTEETIGVVASLVLPEQAPAHVRALIDPKTPYLLTGSYFADVPEEKRKVKGISGEWLKFPKLDGSHEAIPLTFAKSHIPLNGPETGIKQVASIEPLILTQHNSYKQSRTESRTVAPTMTEIETLKSSLTELQKSEASLKTENASLKDQVKAKDARILELEAAALAGQGETFAKTLVSEGKIPADAMSAWADSYVRSAEVAKKLAASLKPAFLPDGTAKAGQAPALTDVQKAALKSIALSAFPEPNKEAK